MIEVVGAFVIFSVGVLMVMRVSSVTTTQMRYAGVSSALALRAAERLDSLEAESFGALTMGTTADTVVVSGLPYQRRIVLTAMTPLLVRVDVTLTPVGGLGPTYTASSYLAELW
jgi:Tfp pilus assembly protein PilV